MYLAFVIYDWLINLEEEIHIIWHIPGPCRLNAAVLLYGLHQYSIIFIEVLNILTQFTMSETVRLLPDN